MQNEECEDQEISKLPFLKWEWGMESVKEGKQIRERTDWVKINRRNAKKTDTDLWNDGLQKCSEKKRAEIGME